MDKFLSIQERESSMKLFRDSEADTYFVLDDDFAFVTIE